MTESYMTSSGTIDYERLAQNAMRGVIRDILKQTEQSGLPGEHHFYVQFETHAPGVNISKRLRERYPDEMTIVLQHRFWDLAVHDTYFEVKLTFDSIPERLVVPFSAIKVFFDPSVRYALQFESLDMAEAMERDAEEEGGGDDVPFAGPRGLTPIEPSPIASIERPSRGAPPALVALTPAGSGDDIASSLDAVDGDERDGAADLDADWDGTTAANSDLDSAPTDDPTDNAKADEPPANNDASDDRDDDDGAETGVVVSLDAFRKK